MDLAGIADISRSPRDLHVTSENPGATMLAKPLFHAFLALSAVALSAMPAIAETRYVRAGHLIDTEKGVVLDDRLIRIDDDRIVSVVPWSPPPAGAVVIDWSAFTVLPGLIDMHTHIADW
eukprot:gene60129-82272_t